MLLKVSYVNGKHLLQYMGLLYCLVILWIGRASEASIYVFSNDYATYKIDEFSDKELSFAVPIERLGIMGAIVSVDPPDGCSRISQPPFINSSMTWLALIAGNYCDYNTKVINAERSGYAAAVIYDINERNESQRQNNAVLTPNISAVSIRTSSGIIIRENYLYTIDARYSILIFPNTSIDIMTYILLFVIGGFVVLLFTVLIMKFVQQVRSPASSRLNSENLSQLQVSIYQKGDPYETCAICLEDYKIKDKLRILPCSHAYHAKCIDPWLTRNRRICPVCKQKVVIGDDFDSDPGSRDENSPLLNNAARSDPTRAYRSTSNIYDSQSV